MSWICSHCGESTPRPRQKCARDGSPVVENLAGQVVGGRYTLQELIGVGGMDSAVWKAWQMGTERVVAIKVLPPADDAAAKRFSRGARIAANLSHPNCCVIHDYGTTEDGKLYLVMEFLSGRVLNDVLTDDGFSPQDTAHIADQILQALEHAHAERTVHRDLKPDNLFLCKKNNDPYHVKILDFGIAKYIEDAHDEMTTGPNDTARDGFDDLVTEQRQVCGTPQYMAPEQVVGARVDGRADLYALGCVMYRLLTGRLPFDGKNRYDLYRKHLEESPRPFSEIRPDLVFPDRLELVVLKALAKNPAHRFQSAAEMRAALETIDLGAFSVRRGTTTRAVARTIQPQRGSAESNELTVEVSDPPRSTGATERGTHGQKAPATRQLKQPGVGPQPAPTVAGGSGLRGPASEELAPTLNFEVEGRTARGPSGPGTPASIPGPSEQSQGGGASLELRVPAGASTEPSSVGRAPRTDRPKWQTGAVLAAAFLAGVGGVALLLPYVEGPEKGASEAAAEPRRESGPPPAEGLRVAAAMGQATPGSAPMAVPPSSSPEGKRSPVVASGLSSGSAPGSSGSPSGPTGEPVPATAWPLEIVSVPPGATVSRAGHVVGTTPLTVDVGIGTHAFTLRAEGYAEVTASFPVRSKEDVAKPRQIMLAPLAQAGFKGPRYGAAAAPSRGPAVTSGGGPSDGTVAPQPQASVPVEKPRTQQAPSGVAEPGPAAPVKAKEQPVKPDPADEAAERVPRRPRATTLDEVDGD